MPEAGSNTRTFCGDNAGGCYGEVQRTNFGRHLARESGVPADVVVPVPDSGVCAVASAAAVESLAAAAAGLRGARGFGGGPGRSGGGNRSGSRGRSGGPSGSGGSR